MFISAFSMIFSIFFNFIHLTPGRKVRRYTKKAKKKKVCVFCPIDVFNLGFFRSDNLVILTVYGILAWKDRQFFLDFMVFSKENTLFAKDHCTKKPHFFLAKKGRTSRLGVIIYKSREDPTLISIINSKNMSVL